MRTTFFPFITIFFTVLIPGCLFSTIVKAHPEKLGCSGCVPKPSARKETCNFFILNLNSCIKYHLCRRLVKDKIYEGLGGKKNTNYLPKSSILTSPQFARIKPGTLLASLYPCSQHKEDSCLICGGSFHSHLRDSTTKVSEKSKPFNDYVDKIFTDAAKLFTESVDEDTHTKNLSFFRRKTRRSHSRKMNNVPSYSESEETLFPQQRKFHNIESFSFHSKFRRIALDRAKIGGNNETSPPLERRTRLNMIHFLVDFYALQGILQQKMIEKYDNYKLQKNKRQVKSFL